jgi:hypothetical protein
MPWELDDIPWNRFEPGLVDATTLALARTACLVEHNSGEYGRYLKEVFSDDPRLHAPIDGWVAEEVRHGEALRRWCELADPRFDFATAFAAFTARIRLPSGLGRSVRGSRPGELLARCVVECGTSFYYSSLRDAVREPALKAICARIAADEFRHYRLFLDHSRRWLGAEPLALPRRLAVLLGRMVESEDDELAYAWHVTNTPAAPYRRRSALGSYLGASLRMLRERHFERSIAMVLRAAGFAPGQRSLSVLARIGMRAVRWRMRRVAERFALAPPALPRRAG